MMDRMENQYTELSPDWTPEYMSKFLSIYPTDTVWKWILLLQDEFIFPPERAAYRGLLPDPFGHAQSMANIAWGNQQPLVSRRLEFGIQDHAEAGISLSYLFSGDVKAQAVIDDISRGLGSRSYDLIRLHLISQMIKHHGILLEDLHRRLNERGKLLVVDADDALNEYGAPLVKVAALFDELTELQRQAGGQRSASERILKSASRFGFRVIENLAIPCTIETPEQRVQYYRLLCLKLDLLTKVFGEKYSRQELFSEAHQWLRTPTSKLVDGMRVLIFEKKTTKFQTKTPKKSMKQKKR